MSEKKGCGLVALLSRHRALALSWKVAMANSDAIIARRSSWMLIVMWGVMGQLRKRCPRVTYLMV
jgi:hypothetical protein